MRDNGLNGNTKYELRALLRDTPVGDGHYWFSILDELLRRQKSELVDSIRETAAQWRRTYHEHPSSPSEMLEWANGADLIADDL